MADGFDFTTSDVQDWELEAVWSARHQEALVFSRHAREEWSLDALTLDDVLDTSSFPAVSQMRSARICRAVLAQPD